MKIPEIKPRRLYDEEFEKGYLESDLDFVKNNLEACVWFLENSERLMINKNIRPCEVCKEWTSFERRAQSDPGEGEVCTECDKWVCSNCVNWSYFGETERVVCIKCQPLTGD